MKKNVWLSILLLGTAALMSSTANATATTTVSGVLQTNRAVLIKFLTKDSWLNFAIYQNLGSHVTTTKTSNVLLDLTNLVSGHTYKADLSYGDAYLGSGVYGRLEFKPTDRKTYAFDWTGSGISVTALPEPEVYALMGIGLVVVYLSRRRRTLSKTHEALFA